MTNAAAPGAPASKVGRVRAAGAVVLIALAAIVALEPGWNRWLPAAGMDGFQLLSPRVVRTLPATIVQVDEKSLAAIGRWPWPRSRLAQLIDAIARHRPAALGIDIFMPEADPLSSEPSASRPNDELLAEAIARTPSVLAFAGTPEATGMLLRVVPFTVQRLGSTGEPTALGVVAYAGAKTSLDAVNRAAAGWGLISVAPPDGTVRRAPLVATIAETLVPAFAVEVLRVAVGASSLRLVTTHSVVRGIEFGNASIPTDADGTVRIHFSPRRADRFVAAVDVLDGNVDPEVLAGRIVLIGVTGIGLGDYHSTPLGVAMPGTEIQAQLLENIVDGATLLRPRWASALEAGALLLFGLLLLRAVPAWSPRNALWLAIACLLAIVGGAFLAFRYARLAFDAATPGVALLLLFGTLLLFTLAEAVRQRRALELAMQAQRERAARMAGELDAARRIQMASLPSAAALGNDPRLDLAATMAPAREVGGDLYDFFRLGPDRLFLLVGDVAGKGLAASIFMAVSKALYKSATFRAGGSDLGALMADANAEISRDNAGMLFVTAFAGVLDLASGELAYCNAGHENPYVVTASGTSLRRLADGGGPPLCAVDGFPYRAARCRLAPGELLCVISDGVTDATNATGERFGHERMTEAIVRLAASDASAERVVTELRATLEAFTSGQEAADDITILALRWLGPSSSAPGSRRGD